MLVYSGDENEGGQLENESSESNIEPLSNPPKRNGGIRGMAQCVSEFESK